MRKDVLAQVLMAATSPGSEAAGEQKEGKKRMKYVGRVEVPQEAFIAALSTADTTAPQPKMSGLASSTSTTRSVTGAHSAGGPSILHRVRARRGGSVALAAQADVGGLRPRGASCRMSRPLRSAAGVDELVAGYYRDYVAEYVCGSPVREGLSGLRSGGWTVGFVTNGAPSQVDKITTTASMRSSMGGRCRRSSRYASRIPRSSGAPLRIAVHSERHRVDGRRQRICRHRRRHAGRPALDLDRSRSRVDGARVRTGPRWSRGPLAAIEYCVRKHDRVLRSRQTPFRCNPRHAMGAGASACGTAWTARMRCPWLLAVDTETSR